MMTVIIDFGGTRIKLGLVEHGEVRAYKVIGSYSSLPFSKWIYRIKKEVYSLCSSGGVDLAEVEGMVWALPVLVAPDLRQGVCSFGKYDDSVKGNFCEMVEQIIGIPLLLENDARAALIGEWQAGSVRGKDNVVMITLGTGIGTSVIFEGKPMRGRTGMAGNLGGLSIMHFGSEALNGRPPGCIESQVSSWALPYRMFRLSDFQDSALSSELTPDYLSIFRHAQEGDAAACQLRDKALESWSALTLNMIQAYDPECVVFGGGIMASEKDILPAIKGFVERHAIQPGGLVEIKSAALKDQAALIGGEWIWKTEMKRTERLIRRSKIKIIDSRDNIKKSSAAAIKS